MPCSSKSSIPAFVLFMTLLITEASIAGITEDKRTYHREDNNWNVLVGAMIMHKQKYEGSKDNEEKVFPYVSISWRDTAFLNWHEGLGLYVWKRPDMKLGISAGYRPGRYESESGRLTGLGNINDGATANILYKWVTGGIYLNTRYEQQITGESTGSLLHLSIGHDIRINRKIIIKPSLKTIYASSDYMDSYFSISRIQAERSGIRPYNADAGLKSAGFRLLGIYPLNRRAGVMLMSGYDRLLNDAADSPLTDDKDQFRVGIGLTYSLY